MFKWCTAIIIFNIKHVFNAIWIQLQLITWNFKPQEIWCFAHLLRVIIAVLLKMATTSSSSLQVYIDLSLWPQISTRTAGDIPNVPSATPSRREIKDLLMANMTSFTTLLYFLMKSYGCMTKYQIRVQFCWENCFKVLIQQVSNIFLKLKFEEFQKVFWILPTKLTCVNATTIILIQYIIRLVVIPVGIAHRCSMDPLKLTIIHSVCMAGINKNDYRKAIGCFIHSQILITSGTRQPVY